MNPIERRFSLLLKSHEMQLREATPGFKIQAFERGKLKLDVEWGRTWNYYDLASLTKIIFTATACGRAIDDGWLHPGSKVVDYWPAWRHKNIRVHDLMSHTAGLPWWRPLYKSLRGHRNPKNRWPQLARRLEKVPRQSSRRAIYSDLDLFVLGQILTLKTGRPLLEIWNAIADSRFTGDLHFNVGSRMKRAKSQYAPTEYCPWRKRILQGEVHDENSWALGGVAPHSGLFGRIGDVSKWGLELRRTWRGESSRLMRPETARLLTKRQIPRTVGDWGWLFMKPSLKRASAGATFSLSSFGHTGFTGTSLWLDPRQDRLVVILSNRVHPSRQNEKFVKIRPQLHNWVAQAIEKN